MPSAQLKSFAEKSGKSMADLERYWDEAKKEALKKFGKKSASFWKYVVGIVERRAGLRKAHESITLRDFIALNEREVMEDIQVDEPGWYVEKGNKIIEGPMEELKAQARAKALGGDKEGYSHTYVSDYQLERARTKD